MKTLLIVLFSLLSLSALPVAAQYTFFNPQGSYAIEVSLQNPPDEMVRLLIYRNSISSLIIEGDHIIGGTSAKQGLAPFVFVASLSGHKLMNVLDINEVIPGQRSIRSGFWRGQNDVLYADTIADRENDGGHLISLKVTSDDSIHVVDSGTPVPKEGIYALTGNAAGTELYGITYPSGLFLSYDIHTDKARIYDDILPSKKDLHTYYEFALEPEDYLSRRLITDKRGMVYGSAPVNKVFYFDPETKKIDILKDALPFVCGRHTLGRVDAWSKSKDGILYGGNGGDGQLFRLDPSTGEVTNLGKPVMMNRLTALAFGGDGKLYGIAGAAPGYARLFSYDAEKGFFDLGNPQFQVVAPDIEQGIPWRGYQMSTMAASDDGKYIVMGEDESLSQLLVFPVDTN